MKVGDLVKYRLGCSGNMRFDEPVGLVVQVDDTHRQTSVSVLFSDGIKKRIWKGHLEAADG